MFVIGSHESIIGLSKNLTITNTQFEYFPNSSLQYELVLTPSDSYYSNLSSGVAPPL